MLSMPPAITTCALPARSRSVASMVAFIPDPHTLLIVVAPHESGSPPRRAACRAGACLTPALTTLPTMTSSTASASIPLRSTAARSACAPSAGALIDFSSP